jgi:L-asparaginase
MLPRVALILTGGTIDSVGRDRLDLAWYSEANRRLDPQELLAQLPELRDLARIELVPFPRLGSPAVTPADWLHLHQVVDGLLQDQAVDGVVITHGTNTLEETAYFLSLTLKTERPVVLVGAMRPASGLSSDAHLNLLNAVRVATTCEAAGQGTLVVMNDTIHAARDVTKTATYRVQAFESRESGPLGYADADGRVVFYRSPARAHSSGTPFEVGGRETLPRVDVVLSYAGQDGVMIEAAVTAGARGIVNAGTGAGRCSPAENAALERAQAAGVVVVQATRVGSGRVVASPDLRRRRIVAAGNLPPWKARILLLLALTLTDEYTAIQAMFDQY